MSLFLDQSDIAILTGKKLKSHQVDALRNMGILFYINAAGRPVVPVSAVEGHKETTEQPDKPWAPAVLKNGSQNNR